MAPVPGRPDYCAAPKNHPADQDKAQRLARQINLLPGRGPKLVDIPGIAIKRLGKQLRYPRLARALHVSDR